MNKKNINKTITELAEKINEKDYIFEYDELRITCNGSSEFEDIFRKFANNTTNDEIEADVLNIQNEEENIIIYFYACNTNIITDLFLLTLENIQTYINRG